MGIENGVRIKGEGRQGGSRLRLGWHEHPEVYLLLPRAMAYERLSSCQWNSGLSNGPIGLEVPGTDVPGPMADSNQGVLTQAPKERQPQGQMAST